MHIDFDPDSFVDWNTVFLEQAEQTGSGGFRGYPFQRGASGLGGLFSKLFKIIVPIAKRASRHIASEALTTSTRIADDLANGRKLGESLRQHGTEGYKHLVEKAMSKLQSGGKGRKVRKSRKKPKRRKRVNKKKSKKGGVKKKKATYKRKKRQINDIFGKWGN